MKKSVFGIVCCVIFILFYKIVQVVYNWFVPYNTFTDVLCVFIMIIVLIPCAVMSTYGCEKVIKLLREKRNEEN